MNRIIRATNENKPRLSSDSCFVDPALFSKAVRNTTLSSNSFCTLIEFMNKNGIPVMNDFLVNSFQAMLCDQTNLNTLLDIISYFSYEDDCSSLPGDVWRSFMKILSPRKEYEQDTFDDIRRCNDSNRHSLLFTLFQYFKKENISFCFPI